MVAVVQADTNDLAWVPERSADPEPFGCQYRQATAVHRGPDPMQRLSRQGGAGDIFNHPGQVEQLTSGVQGSRSLRPSRPHSQ